MTSPTDPSDSGWGAGSSAPILRSVRRPRQARVQTGRPGRYREMRAATATGETMRTGRLVGTARIGAVGLVAVLLLAMQGTAATQKPSNQAAAAAFGDGVVDAITSDGAPYVDGGDGISSELLRGGSFSLLTRGTTRRVNYDLTARISGTGFTGTLSDDSNIGINTCPKAPCANLTDMAVGATIATRAIFNTSIGQFNFDSAA